jgi:hypothetical protein
VERRAFSTVSPDGRGADGRCHGKPKAKPDDAVAPGTTPPRRRGAQQHEHANRMHSLAGLIELALVRRLVVAAGGSVSVVNDPGGALPGQAAAVRRQG